MIAVAIRPLARALVACSVLAAGLLPVGAARAAACGEGRGPGAVHLGDFTSGYEVGSLFYAAPEGTSATAVVRVTPGDCMGPRAVGSFTTVGGTAVEGIDYQRRAGQTPTICDDYHIEYCGSTPRTYPVGIPLAANTGDEMAVESFMFTLTGGSRGVDPPSSVPVHVVDIHGPPRAALEPGLAGYSWSESLARIKVPVFLAGTSGGGSVGYTLTPDAAAPAVPNEDVQDLTGGSVSVGGSRLGFIDLGIVNDQIGEAPESVVITLTGGPGIAVASPSSITVTIEDNEESQKPKSRFHHPRHTWRYKKSDYRIREFHVFASDVGPAGVERVQLALKRTRSNDTCQWFTRKGWRSADCQNRQWLNMKYDRTGDLWLYRMPQLKSSVGTRIKNYTAISRAIDGADNVESQFNEKRNNNTFEIKRSRRR
jgi:hypothetical protein